jgi:DNA-binding response OmpR family regulator
MMLIDEPAIKCERSGDRLLYVGQDSEWFRRLQRVLGLPANCLVYCPSGSIAELFVKSDIRYELFLFDWDLPDEAGSELVWLTRSLAQRQNVPILVVANEVTDGLKEFACRAGTDECVTKVEDMFEAVETIQRLLRKGQRVGVNDSRVGAL